MLIWGAASLRFAVVRTIHAKIPTGLAWDIGIVAFHLAHTTHVAGASKSRELGVNRRVAHHGSAISDEACALDKLDGGQVGSVVLRVWVDGRRCGSGHGSGGGAHIGLRNGFGSRILQRLCLLGGESLLGGIAGGL